MKKTLNETEMKNREISITAKKVGEKLEIELKGTINDFAKVLAHVCIEVAKKAGEENFMPFIAYIAYLGEKIKEAEK